MTAQLDDVCVAYVREEERVGHLEGVLANFVCCLVRAIDALVALREAVLILATLPMPNSCLVRRRVCLGKGSMHYLLLLAVLLMLFKWRAGIANYVDRSFGSLFHVSFCARDVCNVAGAASALSNTGACVTTAVSEDPHVSWIAFQSLKGAHVPLPQQGSAAPAGNAVTTEAVLSSGIPPTGCHIAPEVAGEAAFASQHLLATASFPGAAPRGQHGNVQQLLGGMEEAYDAAIAAQVAGGGGTGLGSLAGGSLGFPPTAGPGGFVQGPRRAHASAEEVMSTLAPTWGGLHGANISAACGSGGITGTARAGAGGNNCSSGFGGHGGGSSSGGFGDGGGGSSRGGFGLHGVGGSSSGSFGVCGGGSSSSAAFGGGGGGGGGGGSGHDGRDGGGSSSAGGGGGAIGGRSTSGNGDSCSTRVVCTDGPLPRGGSPLTSSAAAMTLSGGDNTAMGIVSPSGAATRPMLGKNNMFTVRFAAGQEVIGSPANMAQLGALSLQGLQSQAALPAAAAPYPAAFAAGAASAGLLPGRTSSFQGTAALQAAVPTAAAGAAATAIASAAPPGNVPRNTSSFEGAASLQASF